MDKLVAQYSRPTHQNEFQTEPEEQDFASGLPPLSLKFALPPVDNVSLIDGICINEVAKLGYAVGYRIKDAIASSIGLS